MEAILTHYETTGGKKKAIHKGYNLRCIPNRFVHSHCCDDDAQTVVTRGRQVRNCDQETLYMQERPVVFAITAYLSLHLQVQDILGTSIQFKIKRWTRHVARICQCQLSDLKATTLVIPLTDGGILFKLARRHHWRALADTVMTLRVKLNARNFLNSQATMNFRRRTVSCSYLQNILVTPMICSSNTLR